MSCGSTQTGNEEKVDEAVSDRVCIEEVSLSLCSPIVFKGSRIAASQGSMKSDEEADGLELDGVEPLLLY